MIQMTGRRVNRQEVIKFTNPVNGAVADVIVKGEVIEVTWVGHGITITYNNNAVERRLVIQHIESMLR